MDRLERQKLLAEEARLAGGGPVPYLAHMRVRTAGHERDVLLGARAGQLGSHPLLDWERAPLAALLVECPEGDEYEIELGGRTVEGLLLERNLVGFSGGELSFVATPHEVLTTGAPPRPHPDLLLPRQGGARRRSLAEVDLDPAQHAVLDAPEGTAMMVLGEAGSGKTTVVLRRVARLAKGRKAVVIVPTEPLRGLATWVLSRLGAPEVEVATYDGWAAAQARRAFPGLPKQQSRGAPAAVARVKRDPAVREGLKIVAARLPKRAGRRKSRVRRDDLEHVFGDIAVLKAVALRSELPLGPAILADVLGHTHVQFSASTEEAFAHVDEDRLKTVDGARIDEGTPLEDAGSIDPEDHTLLFEFDRLRAESQGGAAAGPTAYDVVAVDEAQELAPLELGLVGRSVKKGGTLMVAGDAAQQVDAGAFFGGWERTMVELGAAQHRVHRLAMTHRNPPEVAAFARRLVGEGEPPSPSDRLRLVRFGSECHLVAWLADELHALLRADPGAAVGLITRGPEAARRLARLLGRGVPLRLLAGAAEVRAGVQVGHVQDVRGLEFDHVVLPDASDSVYPDTAESRRTLYVAATRASHQLVLAAVGPASTIAEEAAATRAMGWP